MRSASSPVEVVQEAGAHPFEARRGTEEGTRGEIDVFGTWTGFEVAREPLFDPGGARIRA